MMNKEGKFSMIFALVGSMVLLSLNQVYGQENEVIVTIMQGSADAGSCENKYQGEAHAGYGFSPEELTIEKGTTVKWINNDTSTHTVTSGEPGDNTVGTAFDSSYMNEGDVYLHKFNSKKTYDYYCTMYPFMKGKIIVK
ncbi:MAG TPA: plastocyanin/azurin family copper-binding protein [Nitrososphaeraceae archaeon]|nr:plastocyanin/azurin family copper-binding protein [Nitrososphaeraceae archaeon]